MIPFLSHRSCGTSWWQPGGEDIVCFASLAGSRDRCSSRHAGADASSAHSRGTGCPGSWLPGTDTVRTSTLIQNNSSDIPLSTSTLTPSLESVHSKKSQLSGSIHIISLSVLKTHGWHFVCRRRSNLANLVNSTRQISLQTPFSTSAYGKFPSLSRAAVKWEWTRTVAENARDGWKCFPVVGESIGCTVSILPQFCCI